MEITKQSIKLRNGTVLPPGLPLTWDDGKAFVDTGERKIRISAIGAAKALKIPFPTFEQLEEWTYDSICESILGDTVEPDGIDSEGSPSWLLAMGMI